MSDFTEHTVLDLFAGTGVGVAIRQLGASEHAVDIMPEVAITREANGMTLAYTDVWDIEKAAGLDFDTKWSSPPCPSFSMAGNGSGRRQMPLILKAIGDGVWCDIDELREWASTLEDERSGLTLVPLAYIHRFGPKYVAQEQVPAVLPIWEAYATVMREMGYAVWTGYLSSEMYGVPQTRKRAYLLATLGADTQTPPPATHSRYHSRTPARLDPGVQKWVSMAEALGGTVPRPAPTVTGGGRYDGRLGTVWEPRTEGDPRFAVVSNYGTGGDATARGRRMSDEPSATITSKFDRAMKEAA